MYRRFIPDIVLLVSTGAISTINAATRQGSVSASLDYHPALCAASNEQGAAQYQVDDAKAGYRPQISIELSSGRQWANNTTIRSFQFDRNDLSGNNRTIQQPVIRLPLLV